VAGTLPIVSTGGTAPVLSINAATNATAGSMSAADKAKLDGAATIVSAVTGTLPITVATGTSTPLIAINAATTGAQGAVQIGTNIDVTTGTISIKNASATDKGVIEIATLAEAATGTNATLALTPSTGVPKDAATMTGAALIPGGNNAARPGTPVTGMTRYNNQSGTPASMEFYNGVAWSGFGSNWTVSGSDIAPTTATTLKFNSGYGSNATAYGCRAWVNFNGVPASATIRGSGNVSSVTKNSTGNYTVNFTTAMPDANYAVASHFQYDAVAAPSARNNFLQTTPTSGTQGQTT
jgi:hypothetical protein